MQNLKVAFQTNPERGCSEFFFEDFRVIASVIGGVNALDLEIEQVCGGAWYTLYFERAVLDQPIDVPSMQSVARNVFAKVATQKLIALRHRIAMGEVFHPLANSEDDPGWTSQLDSEPL